jgi:hypothetical protein
MLVLQVLFALLIATGPAAAQPSGGQQQKSLKESWSELVKSAKELRDAFKGVPPAKPEPTLRRRQMRVIRLSLPLHRQRLPPHRLLPPQRPGQKNRTR